MVTSRILAGALIACSVVLARGVAEASSTSTTFPTGSLVIPTEAAFQDDCGAVSTYGLVYDVLRAEAWLVANGKPAIQINYVVADTKQSPNRCVPSNLHTAPSVNTAWSDGCDFSITNSTGNVATLVNNAATASANDTTIATVDTTLNSNVYPQYTSKSLGSTATTIGYLGGPFVISATDAPNFLSLLDGTYAATDAAGDPIDFSAFRRTATCILGSTHHVNIHRAKTSFTAPVRKVFTTKPPRLAVLSTDSAGFYVSHSCPTDSAGCGVVTSTASVAIASSGGATELANVVTFTTTSAHGLNVGDVAVVSGVTKAGYNGRYTVVAVLSATKFTVTSSVTGLTSSGGGSVTQNGSIMENYLANAGLDFSGAQGCPTGGQNVGNAAICPNGGAAGEIYDIFDFADVVSNKFTVQDSGVNRYTMFWTPHWVTTAGTSSAATASETTAMANVKTFLDGQTGLLAECAAISSFEGAYVGTTSKDLVTGALQLQTCIDNSGACSSSTTSWGMDRNPASEPTGTLHNCTDPTGAGSSCVKFGAPTDEFVQIAEYLWNTDSGHVTGFQPAAATTSMFKPGVIPLIATYTGSGSTLRGYYASRNIKDNTPGKANVMYLGGHDQSGNVAGSKVALQTLLLLGISSLPPVTNSTDTTRSNPIIATVGATPTTALVVGSFANVQPAPTPPIVTASADFTGWSFPFVTGHLRATDTSVTSITTAASQLGTGTVLFDAAANLPAVTASGCGVLAYSGSCRTIFTTTAVPSTTTGLALHPAITTIDESNAATIGPLMAVGSSLSTATDYKNLMDRTLAGYPNGSGGYVAALGGIDRSTVAVIGASTLANSTRPTIAYVGAADGMLHAICATIDATHGCPALGTEMWAFLPRAQLPWVRLNKAKIDGSPRVIDAFGNFGSGTKSFRTILMFTTGSGDSTSATAAQPAMYALDITNPQAPTVVWEYSIANPGTARGVDAYGVGMALAAGTINMAGVTRNIVVSETTDGGTAGAADATAGIVVTALDMETGAQMWSPFIYSYPNPTRSGGALVPHTGVPGGVVGIDKQGQGFLTDLVFGDLYGNVWELDATTGLSRYPTKKALFSFSTDFHPIGSLPAIYSNGSQQFAVVSSGGYVDLADTPSWGAGKQQSVVAMALNAPASDTTFSETAGTSDVPFKFNFSTTSEAGFAQATIVGGQLFVTTDNSDVNATGFGTAGATGHVYTSSLSSTTTVVGIEGGASSIANAATSLFTASSNQQQRLSASATSTTGPSVDTVGVSHLIRLLWVRTK